MQETEMRKVWVVTYYDEDKDRLAWDPTVTVFDNKNNAVKCYESFLCRHHKAAMDECPVYSDFYESEV